MVAAAFAIRSRQMPASFGVQGPGESTMASGSAAITSSRCDLVVAMHDDLRPQSTEIVEQVEGEAVVIVDQNDHARPFSCPLKVLDASSGEGQEACLRATA